MRRVDAFYLFPAVCASFGTTSGGGVVLERDVEGYRPDKLYRLYLCDPCVTEVAEHLGYVTPDAMAAAVTGRDAALTELELHRDRAAGTAAALRLIGEVDWLDRCGVCDWAGKSLPQKARFCKVDECPYRKGEPAKTIQDRLAEKESA